MACILLVDLDLLRSHPLAICKSWHVLISLLPSPECAEREGRWDVCIRRVTNAITLTCFPFTNLWFFPFAIRGDSSSLSPGVAALRACVTRTTHESRATLSQRLHQDPYNYPFQPRHPAPLSRSISPCRPSTYFLTPVTFPYKELPDFTRQAR